MHNDDDEMGSSESASVRVSPGDGGGMGDLERSGVGEGDLDSLGFDFVRRAYEDNRKAAGNVGGAILTSVTVVVLSFFSRGTTAVVEGD